MQLKIEQVSKRYESRAVLKDISLDVEQGKFVALLGPSGCGKTTLLNALAGLIDIDGGSIVSHGEVWSSRGKTLAPERRNVGMVFQDFALWPHMSVFDNIAFGLKIQRKKSVDIAQRVTEVLELTRMNDYAAAYPHQLSGGQKQRVAIARALAPRPSLLLMDEPLSSLDAKLREQMRWELLGIVQAAKITTVYVTHDQTEALSMADEIVLLNDGWIEQRGTPMDLYRRPRTAFAASFLGASNLLPVRVLSRSGDRVLVECCTARLNVPATNVSEPVQLHARPSDVILLDSSEPGVLTGRVIQRAYQGTTWQYRVRLTGNDEQIMEVWDEREWSVGTEVSLALPEERCLLLASNPSEATREDVGRAGSADRDVPVDAGEVLGASTASS